MKNSMVARIGHLVSAGARTAAVQDTLTNSVIRLILLVVVTCTLSAFSAGCRSMYSGSSLDNFNRSVADLQSRQAEADNASLELMVLQDQMLRQDLERKRIAGDRYVAAMAAYAESWQAYMSSSTTAQAQCESCPIDKIHDQIPIERFVAMHTAGLELVGAAATLKAAWGGDLDAETAKNVDKIVASAEFGVLIAKAESARRQAAWPGTHSK